MWGPEGAQKGMDWLHLSFSMSRIHCDENSTEEIKKKIFFKQNCLRTKMKKQTLLPEKGKQITQSFLGFFIKLEGIWKPTWTSQIQIAFVL